jgi:pimeloyl-ACP methyl ester carboxylesterase
VNGIHNYKLIRYHDINYGELLLQMVAHVIREWGDIDQGPFSLSGFSGGAQFAHRFWYLYPDHIASLAIAAPGAVTLLDPTLQWPRGIQDDDVDLSRLRRARVTVIVGDQDAGTGYSRIEVAGSLRESLHNAGIEIDEVTLVNGAGHEEWKLQATLERWFESCMGI